jgi:type I restriction enzyme M protein
MPPVPRVAKTSDPLGRYYTGVVMARHLVQAMAAVLGTRSPETVLDLGAGGGALVLECARTWPAGRFITVDVDPAAESRELAARFGAAFRHHHGSALGEQLEERLAPLGSFDAAVCNPPYIRTIQEPHFASILDDAGLADVCAPGRAIASDLLFIAQNLRFLRPGGVLGLIIPDGMLAGERYGALRKALASRHRIAMVVELPRRIFKRTDAKAHILVLEKDVFDGGPIPVCRVELDGSLSAPILLTSAQAGQRLDYSFYVNSQLAGEGLPLREMGVLIWRGRISSGDRKAYDFPVFHTSDFVEPGFPAAAKFQLTAAQASRVSGRLAESGDILLARIGRTLEQKICIVEMGPVAVSDSVLVLRAPPDMRDGVLRFLTSALGRSALGNIAHGVAARFITAGAVADLRIPVSH